MWYYNSPIGTMRIFLDVNRRYTLEINGEAYGSYPSPQSAADDVYTHTTDCYEWDLLDGTILDVPSGIDEWESNL